MRRPLKAVTALKASNNLIRLAAVKIFTFDLGRSRGLQIRSIHRTARSVRTISPISIPIGAFFVQKLHGWAAPKRAPKRTERWREQYTPFGETLQNSAANDNLDGFTGHIKDSATRLNYMQARYYDPVIGRFLSIDPVTFMDTGMPGQFNRYAYTWNDPINANDPDGEFLNFVAKFVVDVGLEVAIQAATGQEINLGAAAKGAALGVLDPTKTARKAAKLAGAVNDVRKARSAQKVGAACPICFTAGTLVDTETGQRPIEDIQIGDKVWAWDEVTKTTALKPVTHTVPFHERVIWDVVFEDASGSQTTIETTDEHPWWILGQGWVETRGLTVGVFAKLATAKA